MNVLLDSVILIDHFNGRPEATEYLRQERRNATISVITRAEVLAGFDQVGTVRAKSLLDLFPVLAMTKEVADLAATLRRQNTQTAIRHPQHQRLSAGPVRICDRPLPRAASRGLKPRRGVAWIPSCRAKMMA